ELVAEDMRVEIRPRPPDDDADKRTPEYDSASDSITDHNEVAKPARDKRMDEIRAKDADECGDCGAERIEQDSCRRNRRISRRPDDGCDQKHQTLALDVPGRGAGEGPCYIAPNLAISLP